MNHTYFQDANDVVDECELLVNEDRYNAEDRAAIASFYNGRETMTAADAERQGITELTNHLFGHDAIATASNQIASITTKSPTIFKIKLLSGPQEKRDLWQTKITEALNKAIVRSKRFNAEWKAASGEVSLYGRSHLLFPDNEDWCPIMRRPYVPRGTKAGDPPKFLCIRDRMTLRRLYRMKAHAERVGEGSSWKLKGINSVISALEGNFKPGTKNPTSHDLSNTVVPDEQEFERQEGADNASRNRTTIPVYFMFSARDDEAGCPYDLTIVARFSSQMKHEAEQQAYELNPLLFDEDGYFPSARRFIHSFFVDVSIGGETTWHRTEGLGHLNYDSDVDTEEFFNAAMQGSKENLRRMFKVSTSADRETLDRWLMGDEYNNVIPEGVDVVEGTRNPNFQYAFTTIQMLQQLSRRNARSSISNSDLGKSVDELEVQALERQGRSAEAIANRMNDIYLSLDEIGEEMFRRFTNDTVLPIDGGYDEIKYFQDCLKESGIPLKFLGVTVNGRLKNVEVRVNRVAGDGDSVREQIATNFLMNSLGLYSPQSQQIILRRITAQQTRDHDLAQELVPEIKTPPHFQVLAAQQENDAALANGVSRLMTGQPFTSPLNREDIHEEHLPVHMIGLTSLLARGQVQPWTEVEAEGFSALGRHAMLHVQALYQAESKRQIAQQFEAQLKQLAGAADQLVAQLQQRRQQEQDQPSAVEVEKLRQGQEKIDLAKEKERAIQDDRTIKNTLKAHEIAASDAGKKEQLSQEERKLNRDLARLEMEQTDRDIAMQETLAGTREGQGNKTQ